MSVILSPFDLSFGAANGEVLDERSGITYVHSAQPDVTFHANGFIEIGEVVGIEGRCVMVTKRELVHRILSIKLGTPYLRERYSYCHRYEGVVVHPEACHKKGVYKPSS